MHLIGGIVMAVGAIISLGNLCVIASVIVKRRRGSIVPVIGGLMACVGCTLVADGRYGLVALVVDPGCAVLGACLLNDKLTSSPPSARPGRR